MKKNKIEGKTYRHRCRSQVELWAQGVSIHNTVDDECCPDFSCCKPQMKASDEERQTFLNANEDERSLMCFKFLGTALAHLPSTRVKGAIHTPNEVVEVEFKKK